MYFDSVSFRKSLWGYIKPLHEAIQDSFHSVPMTLTKFKEDCQRYWRENKPKSIGGVASELLTGPILLLPLLCVIIWFAIYNPESKKLGWFSPGLCMLLYALSVPVAVVALMLFNSKFGLRDRPQA
jgi:hypothetical protein